MNDINILEIEDIFEPVISEYNAPALHNVIKDFVKSYIDNKDKPVENWLGNKMQEYLPEKTSEEIKSMTDEIINTIELNEKKKASLQKAIDRGQNKESWFAGEVKKVTSVMSTQKSAEYLKNLDDALAGANDELHKTIITQAGNINNNPCLDGFIAEQYHAQTFNMNAEAAGSPYRAKVLEPDGNRYTKNSVDIVIFDGDGKIAKRYQSKYCKNSDATMKAFKHGDYRGQQKLVPADQKAEIHSKGVKCTSVIEIDGVSSNPLSKSKAEEMRDKAQSGNLENLNWNEYKIKDLAIGIGKQAGYAALQGAAIGAGFDIAKKLCNGEEINGEEVIETAIKSGADFGVKAATAGALKVAAEKGIINLTKNMSTLTNIAHVAVENIKIAGKVVTGELTVNEGVEKIQETTISTTTAIMTMGKGAAIGRTVGRVFGFPGQVIGGFVGGTIGYMAGSETGKKISKGVNKLCDGAKKVVKTVESVFVNGAKAFAGGIKSFLSAVF